MSQLKLKLKPHYALLIGAVCGTGISASVIDWQICPHQQPQTQQNAPIELPSPPEIATKYQFPTHYATGLYTAH